MSTLRFHDLEFDDELLGAVRADGTGIRFTRQERALLRCFVERPGRLLTRAQLLSALAADPDASDRNVDFLINRLRARLGDSARQPRFIATRYGEGYVWTARADDAGAGASALFVVGPAWNLEPGDAQAQAFLAHLHAVLAAGFGEGVRVSLEPAWQAAAGQAVAYSLGTCFHRADASLHMALVLRHEPTQRIVHAHRVTVAQPEALAHEAGQAAAAIRAALWRQQALPAGTELSPGEVPLQVRLHEAASLLASGPQTWRENAGQLRRALEEAPDDPELSMLWALNRYYELVFHAGQGYSLTWEEWEEIESEIETLVLRHLPAVQGNAMMVLAAAKLLFFIDRGHAELAERLVEQTFAHSTAFAAAFALQGQLRMSRGLMAEALLLYDQGLALSEEGSEFWCYLVVLKCSALLAEGRYDELDAVAQPLYRARPQTRLQLRMLFTDPARGPDADVQAVLGAMDLPRARAAVRHLYRVTARHMREPRHRAQVMAGLLACLQPRFGAQVIEPAVAAGLVTPPAQAQPGGSPRSTRAR